MFCKHCGKELNDNAKFCGGCGAKLNENQSNPHTEANIKSNNVIQEENNHFNQKKKRKKGVFIGVGVVAVLLIFMIIGMFSGNEYISAVKEGTFNYYPDELIGKSFDNFFSNPEWKHFVTDTEENVVEFTGDCTYGQDDVTVLLQFTVYDNDEFEVTYFSMNNITQDLNSMLTGLLETVFEGDENAESDNLEDSKALDEYFAPVEIEVLKGEKEYNNLVESEMMLINALLDIWDEDYSKNFEEYNDRIKEIRKQKEEYESSSMESMDKIEIPSKAEYSKEEAYEIATNVMGLTSIFDRMAETVIEPNIIIDGEECYFADINYMTANGQPRNEQVYIGSQTLNVYSYSQEFIRCLKE